jgi:DNA-binding beta-propeller fold protein YncE
MLEVCIKRKEINNTFGRWKMKLFKSVIAFTLFLLMTPTLASAEILGMMSYESKSPDSLKSLKLSGVPERREGIAIIDLDPNSEAFGKILWDMPLPADLVAHHIFYDRTMTKAYVTSLAKPELQVLDLTKSPYRTKTISVEGCAMGEDVIINEDNTRWYLTCMMSANVIVGDVQTDEVVGIIDVPDTYPHGLAVHSEINRILITSTVKGDLTDAREDVTVVDATTLEVLGSHKLSNKPSPSGVAPVEILFVPDAEIPTAYVSNMFGNTLWTMTWDEAAGDFVTAEAYDTGADGANVPLEIYFTNDSNRMYVSSASPGFVQIFDTTEDKAKPKLVKTIDTDEGSHHIAFTQDGKYAFVQNALLNLPGMSSGTINVIDLETQEMVATMDTLSNMGLNPNVIVLLPDNNDFAGH